MIKLRRSLFVVLFMLTAYLNVAVAQNHCPGINVIGYGYDVFDEYANNKSVKEPLFSLGNYGSSSMDDGQEYSIPDIIRLKFVNEKDYIVTEGSSLQQYASSMNTSVGLSVDAFLFEGSIDMRFGKNKSSQTNNYFYTIIDWTRIWEVYIDPLKTNLRQYLTPDARNAIDSLPADELYKIFGTHYVSTGYFGGAMEFNLSESFTSQEEAYSIGSTVKAKYKAVSGEVSIEVNNSSVNEKFSNNIKINARGGDVQYTNKSSVNDNNQYNLWVKSIPTKAVLIDFKEGSLCPIWELAGTLARKEILKKEFNKMVASKPMPQGNASSIRMKDQVYYISSVSNSDLYWDLAGYHYNAIKKGGKIGLYQKDVNKEGWQGADRFIKVIPHSTKPEYVFLQPQHSDFVADITGGVNTAGAELQLWTKGEDNKAQMFKMTEVSGQANTYYIENRGMYLTANTGRRITQEKKTGNDNQKWLFKPANALEEMAPPPTEKFRIKNVAGGLYIDIPGVGPSIAYKNGVEVQVYNIDRHADRTIELQGIKDQSGRFVLQPMHDKRVFDIKGQSTLDGARVHLWDRHNGASQQFEFEYAGDPLTYYIKNVKSDKYLQLDASSSSVKSSKLTQSALNSGDNKKWKLESIGSQWIMPDPNQAFYIRCAYSEKYLDLPGSDKESNKNGKKLGIWKLDNGNDRKFKFKASGQDAWLFIEAQNGGRMIDIPGGNQEKDVQLQVYEKNSTDAQKFAIMATSPSTCMILSSQWYALTVKSDKINEDGSAVILWSQHNHPSQQYVLIYADGPKKGQEYSFF